MMLTNCGKVKPGEYMISVGGTQKEMVVVKLLEYYKFQINIPILGSLTQPKGAF
jgi:hypothetical protein